MLIAEVCANIQAKSIDKTFTYKIPARLNFLTAGWRVIVPFGKQKIDGFILSVKEIPDDINFPFTLKEIVDVIDDEAWFTPSMLSSAKWLADFYLCPLAQSMSLFMPLKHSRKISSKFEKVFKLVKTFDAKNFTSKPAQLKALKILQEKILSSSQLRKEKISNATINHLVKAGYVEVETGKGLSTNDFTTSYKNALDSLVSGSQESFDSTDIADIFDDGE